MWGNSEEFGSLRCNAKRLHSFAGCSFSITTNFHQTNIKHNFFSLWLFPLFLQTGFISFLGFLWGGGWTATFTKKVAHNLDSLFFVLFLFSSFQHPLPLFVWLLSSSASCERYKRKPLPGQRKYPVPVFLFSSSGKQIVPLIKLYILCILNQKKVNLPYSLRILLRYEEGMITC